MKKICFFPNTSKQEAVNVANELQHYVKSLGIDCFTAPSNTSLSEADFLVVLGGDGTMLRAARETAAFSTPLLGINIGKLGYLTDVEPNRAKEAISAVINGNFKTEKRMMLEAKTDCPNSATLLALNDFYIYRGAHVRLLEFEIYVNGEFIEKLSSDGLIICTPTGSTAYNLSAGGPILKPNAEMIAITPICPHALHARPFVLPSNDEIVIKIATDGQTPGNLVFADGEIYCGRPCGKITIKRSSLYASIIKTNDKSFFDVMRMKLIEKL